MTSTTKNNLALLKNKFVKIILPLIIILAFWEILYLIEDNNYFVPSISETLSSLLIIVIGRSFWSVIFTSILRVVLGLFLGIILGTSLAALSHYSSTANAILTPIMSIIKATPVACIIVLLWIKMTYSELTVFVVLLMVMPIIWQNAVNAYQSIDNDLLEVALVFEFTAFKKFRLLILPALLKYLIPAIITSIGLAWKAEIAAEIMTNSNMGRLIYNYKNVTYDTASIFAWTILIVTFSIIFEKSAKYVLRRFINESID